MHVTMACNHILSTLLRTHHVHLSPPPLLHGHAAGCMPHCALVSLAAIVQQEEELFTLTAAPILGGATQAAMERINAIEYKIKFVHLHGERESGAPREKEPQCRANQVRRALGARQPEK